MTRSTSRRSCCRSDSTTAVIVTVDAVAIGEIGSIGNDYLPKVRARIEKELGIATTNVLINASHCHGIVCADVDERTVQAVREAAQNMVPVKVGVGVGHEDRIMENRRLKLKNGREADVRHAYSLPPDEEVAEVGPIDPQIGVLRLDRKDGRTLAVVYNFACHPIQGVPSGGNTADITGFASTGDRGQPERRHHRPVPAGLRRRHQPGPLQGRRPSAQRRAAGQHAGPEHPAGLEEGADAGTTAALTVLNETLELPRADAAERIAALEAEQNRLLQSLQGDEPQPEDVPPAGREVQRVGRVSVVLLAPLSARGGARRRRPASSSTPRTAGT